MALSLLALGRVVFDPVHEAVHRSVPDKRLLRGERRGRVVLRARDHLRQLRAAGRVSPMPCHARTCAVPWMQYYIILL